MDVHQQDGPGGGRGGAVDTVILAVHPLHGEEPAARQSAGALFDVPVAVIDHPRAPEDLRSRDPSGAPDP